MKQAHRTGVFGRRRELPTVIIARGEDIRYFTVRPWMALLAGSLLVTFALSFISATAYLVLRDDLIGATVARQARMQQTYEDRIAALRAQVDRITSRQMLERQLVQRRMAKLIERQEQLTRRHSRLDPVLERADQLRAESVPVPSPRPDRRAARETDNAGRDLPATATAFADAAGPARVPWPLRPGHVGADTDQIFLAIDRSLHDMESDQVKRIGSLAETAYQTSEAISEALDAAGVRVAAGYGEEDVGGPLLAAVETLPFEEQVRELDEALDRLEELKQTARRIPISNPAPDATVSSSFGMRRDPILGRPAHHSGIDFRVRFGRPVRAAGSGTVVKAGWNGGYGRMVEIDHGDGFTTRYAHLSKILVKEGAHVGDRSIVGRVGSSGRSTGPHLHYEVRRNGKPVDPLTFISAGRRLQPYL